MGTRGRVIIIFVVVSMGLGGGVAIGQAQESTDSSIIGPYTEILIPFEDLPALNEDLVFRPVIDQYESGATLQVMYVLEDPRAVPLARYAYYSEDIGVVAPNNMPIQSDLPEYHERMEEILSFNPKTVNVYIRAEAPADKSVPDPLFWDQRIGFHNPNRPALLVYFSGNNGSVFRCAVPEYINGTEPYQLPPDIDGGDAVGSDGLYDPTAYAPPQPWYYNENNMLQAGEIREGWVSCMAPDMPVENITIWALYSYTPEPQSTPTPGPSPTPFGSECVVVDSLDDPACIEAECCMIILIDPTMQALEETSQVLEETAVADENYYVPQEEIGSVPAWSYTRTSTIPDDGIRIDDTSMVFINDEGDQKTAEGTVLIKAANVVQIERYEFNDFLFVAEINVEPDGLSEEDLQGYALYRIYAEVEVFEQANSSTVILEIEEVQNRESSIYERYLSANFQYSEFLDYLDTSGRKLPFDNIFRHDPDSPFAGYIFADLIAERRYSPLSLRDSEWNELIPTTLWFNIDSTTPGLSEIDDTKVRDLTRYAAKGVIIHNTGLEASTTMCDVVECLDVRDPNDHNNEVRAVPLMCPGEWANNFIINGVTLENIDSIGEPGERVWIRAYMQSRDIPQVTWVIDGKILGGLSPWQSIKNQTNNLELVSLENRIILDTDADILPYYFKDSDSYYLPVRAEASELGWINHDVSNNVLMFSVVEKQDSKKENNVVLFLEEGPAWKTGCSRALNPAITSLDVYSPPLNGSSFEIYERYHRIRFLMPGVYFPVSEPAFSGGFALGEKGPSINGQTKRPAEAMIIPGRANIPIYYVPSEEKYYPFRKNESDNNRIYLRNADALLIPQSSSLVLVKVEREPISSVLECGLINEAVHISYPGYYPISAENRKILDFNTYFDWICTVSGTDAAWLVFRFPSLDIDLNKMVLSIKGADNWVTWGLGQN